MKSWLIRLAIVYLVLYALPFPLTLLGYVTQIPLLGDIPGLGAALGWITGLYGQVMNPLASWVGDIVFGVAATPEGTGSGDRTFNYLQLLVTAGLALIGGSAWSAIAARQVSPKTVDAALILARYYLATTLLTYGWAKLFPLQFSIPGPDRLIQSYGDSSPMGLAWTFLGASTGYQMFSGIAELIGGYLLFWRRTSLLGALISAAVMSNVMAINYFYDVPVKLFSTHLFLASLFIMAPEVRRIAGVVGLGAPPPDATERRFWPATRTRQIGLLAAHLLFVVVLTGFHITGSLTAARTYGFLRETSPLAGIYRVESFERGGLVDRENEDLDRWVRVGMNPPSVATVQRATGDATRMRLSFDTDEQTLSFFDRGGQPPDDPQFRYAEVEPGVLRLEGVFEGQETVLVMRRDEAGALLTERGYHWINEFPFNR